jgi:IstB-like ATP binding protein
VQGTATTLSNEANYANYVNSVHWNPIKHRLMQRVVSRGTRVKKTDAETQVLFEFIAHRYESGSLIITSNQPFRQWDQIFPDHFSTKTGQGN